MLIVVALFRESVFYCFSVNNKPLSSTINIASRCTLTVIKLVSHTGKLCTMQAALEGKEHGSMKHEVIQVRL